uniref:Zinc finger CCHC domain-containing protein 8 n=1 Tax=Tetraodon nigroviridis TaxID=99883 RepID=H3C108_TETNG
GKMADVDFGNTELFGQLGGSLPPVSKHIRFTEDDEDCDEIRQLRSRLEECEDYNQRLAEENIIHKHLKRKQSILTRPSGITVENVHFDGPVLQILYTNNAISKICRQEIEDCICGVIAKHHSPNKEMKRPSFNIKPQHSAFVLDEDPYKSSTSAVKTVTEAFKVIGSVSYFTTFCLDKLGQPLVNENPQMTDGWDIPVYHQIFQQVIGAEGVEIEMKDKRLKSVCFNCGLSGHQLRDCPKPKDMAAINERRKEFVQNNNQVLLGNQRYHADEIEERFAKYRPGILSDKLLTALGVDGHSLPPLIYRMRQLGYPPGWLKEAEMENSGLTLYDGNVSNDNIKDDASSQNISYDVSKLVDFPGFNVPAPRGIRDDFLKYGSVPMQGVHQKQNFSAYLSNNFPKPGTPCNKRPCENISSPKPSKKTRRSPNSSSDMDVESVFHPFFHSEQIQEQIPLPPGSPCFSSPPPLPLGTPPATPTPPPLPKGTPPLTPSNGSLAVQGQNWRVVDEIVEGTEDELTLEELEEQQRMIWAALKDDDTTTTSDCETLVPSSASMSTPVQVSKEIKDAEEVAVPEEPVEPCHNSAAEEQPGPQEMPPQEMPPQEMSPQELSPQDLRPVKGEDDSPQPVRAQSPGLEGAPDPASQDLRKVTAVPHRSFFAAGIVPFEDTPEFTEVAAATGTYLKIRDLLKSSPRSMGKKK